MQTHRDTPQKKPNHSHLKRSIFHPFFLFFSPPLLYLYALFQQQHILSLKWQSFAKKKKGKKRHLLAPLDIIIVRDHHLPPALPHTGTHPSHRRQTLATLFSNEYNQDPPKTPCPARWMAAKRGTETRGIDVFFSGIPRRRRGERRRWRRQKSV